MVIKNAAAAAAAAAPPPPAPLLFRSMRECTSESDFSRATRAPRETRTSAREKRASG